MAAKIKEARVAAAHEGIAEMVVTIEYDNGGKTDVALGHCAVDALLTSANAKTLEDLVGTSWEQVRNALSVSFNRD
jgi:hypothetical protein